MHHMIKVVGCLKNSEESEFMKQVYSYSSLSKSLSGGCPFKVIMLSDMGKFVVEMWHGH